MEFVAQSFQKLVLHFLISDFEVLTCLQQVNSYFSHPQNSGDRRNNMRSLNHHLEEDL